MLVSDDLLASPVSPGEIVAGKYRVEGVLGVGAMGIVVRARHTTLGQVVAIKLLLPNRFDSPARATARFLDEARAAARIQSDHVCRVFDVGTLASGVPFMVMEHLEGRNLDQEVAQRGELEIVEAVDFVLQAADALAAAHEQGVVHRDVKPANLFLANRPDGTRRMKVLDFGVSKVTGGAESASDAADRPSLGTPAYMAPEQVRGEPDVDARADVWALGAILYELVTGQMAFAGEDVNAVLEHVLNEDPCPMARLRREVPAEVEAIVMRCLERDRARRWPTAATFARALSPFGSPGSFGQLASVQRELGSVSSMRVPAANSVDPVVASVRPSVTVAPDSLPLRERELLVGDWKKRRTRRRVERIILLGLAAAASLVAAVAIFSRDGAAPAGLAATAAPSRAALSMAESPQLAPPPETVPVPAPREALAPSGPSARAAAAGGVRSAPSSVQTSRNSGGQDPAAADSAGAARPSGSTRSVDEPPNAQK